LEGVFYDCRFALRGLWRDWTFMVAVIAILALAIGLNVIVFTIMNAMVFRGAPAREAQQLAGLHRSPEAIRPRSVCPVHRL
jgi:hypothetical protein